MCVVRCCNENTGQTWVFFGAPSWTGAPGAPVLVLLESLAWAMGWRGRSRMATSSPSLFVEGDWREGGDVARAQGGASGCAAPSLARGVVRR